ncbi:MAG: hypothetical protein ACI9DS_002585, partial [Glaciecola sp.]
MLIQQSSSLVRYRTELKLIEPYNVLLIAAGSRF